MLEVDADVDREATAFGPAVIRPPGDGGIGITSVKSERMHRSRIVN
jgi:hypothetical protein